MRTFFEALLALIGLFIFFPVLVFVLILGFFDTGSPVFIQKRMGMNKRAFHLIKFRTMKVETKSVASHLADATNITKLGAFLRASKIDELPQLINVLLGDMSFVGPRPNLFNQYELIECRDEQDIYSVKPGITGLAQIQNIDMSTPKTLARVDRIMIDELSFKKYVEYIIKTITGSGRGDVVK